MTQYGLSKQDVDNIITTVSNNSEITEIILFGSRALGTYKNGSHIDLALKGNDLNLNTILTVSMALDELDLPYQFDLILYDRIKEQTLKNHINTKGLVLYP